ncbi:MAG: DUF3737 family protein [Oscillospiraceae bacterium]|nr:DUF3737 family protein [Candidatus Equicaccousia limihippi]
MKNKFSAFLKGEKTEYKGQTFSRERALYGQSNVAVQDCFFMGDEDGESALKEVTNLAVYNTEFHLRYPLWHVQNFAVCQSIMANTCRAACWYSKNGVVSDCKLDGIKVFRECENLALTGISASSPEMLWRCRRIAIAKSEINSEYFMFECKNCEIAELKMSGKYSFQYTENVKIENSVLNTKDAFWHSKNVTVINSELNGEYLGWYSQNLTLINCKISGTQPLCYCKNLKLVDCTMEHTDLSFEYSTVNAVVNGNIVSVKNPIGGKITADSIGEVILEGSNRSIRCKITDKSKADS